jgi:hypothetical protein
MSRYSSGETLGVQTRNASGRVLLKRQARGAAIAALKQVVHAALAYLRLEAPVAFAVAFVNLANSLSI